MLCTFGSVLCSDFFNWVSVIGINFFFLCCVWLSYYIEPRYSDSVPRYSITYFWVYSNCTSSDNTVHARYLQTIIASCRILESEAYSMSVAWSVSAQYEYFRRQIFPRHGSHNMTWKQQLIAFIFLYCCKSIGNKQIKNVAVFRAYKFIIFFSIG